MEAGSTILEEDSLFTPLQVKSKGNCYPLITFKLSGPVSLDLAPNYFVARKAGSKPTPASVMFENERYQGPRLIIAFHSTGRERGGGNNLAVQWILALRGLVLMAAPKLYERAAMSMDAIPLVRLVFGVIVAIGLCLTYVAWLAKPPSPSAKTNEANDAG